MPKYQIEFKEVSGGAKSFHYKYFDTEDYGKGITVESIAADVASDTLENDKQNASFRSFGYFKPLKTLTVREMDMETKKPKRGGYKFKLHLTFIQFTTDSGRKERKEWYQYNG